MENKKRLIDANEAKRQIIAFATGCHSEVLTVDSIIMMLNQSDTIDAVEVVHGRWEYGKWEQGHWVKGNERCRCSVCHRDFAVDNSNIWHGCPQCLAKMDGDRNG